MLKDSRICYILTGVFLTNLKGASQNWLRERTHLSIPIPALPSNAGLHIEHWAPYFTMNSVYNKNTAINSGHAVDSFGVEDRENDSNFGQGVANFFEDIAVRDIDAYLFRIGYNVTLTGILKPYRPIE